MRIFPIVKFYTRRHWLALTICMAIMLATTLISLCFMVTQSSTVVSTQGGQIEVFDTGTSMNVYRDPSTIAVGFDLTTVIIVIALILIKKNRELLTTLSVTRYEQILSGFVYVVFMSAVLTFMGKVILPMLVYGIMALCGINVQGGWTASLILTGNNPNFFKDLYDSFIFMIALGGLFTLLGYVMVRWWKIILVAGAVLTVTAIIMFTQYSTSKFIVYLIEHIEEIVQYIEDVIIPFFDRILDNSDTALYTLRYLAFSVLCTALSYPIMRRMPVR